MKRIRLLGVAIAAALIPATVLAAGSPAMAAPGRIDSGGGSVNIRSGPGTSYPIVGSIANGTSVTIACTAVNSTYVTGPTGGSSVWDNIGGNRWIADALVNTGTFNPVEGRCMDPGRYPWPAADTWIADGMGYWAGECVSFVAWAVHNDRIADRYSPDWLGNAWSWNDYGIPYDRNPTVGSVAIWDRDISGAPGHVAYVTGVYSDGTIQIAEYNWNQWHRYDTRRISRWEPSGYLHF